MGDSMNINIKHIERIPIILGRGVIAKCNVAIKDLAELEANYQEAIKALKRLVSYNIFLGIQEECSNQTVEEGILKREINIIEKATGKNWKELK